MELSTGERELTIEILYKGEKLLEGGIEVFRSIEPTSKNYEEYTEVEVDGSGRATFVVDPSYSYLIETDHRV